MAKAVGKKQARLAEVLPIRECERLLADWRADPELPLPELWLTYHLYYKAPDWLGPAVRAALGIPYVVAEASVAPKRAGGPLGQWSSRRQRGSAGRRSGIWVERGRPRLRLAIAAEPGALGLVAAVS